MGNKGKCLALAFLLGAIGLTTSLIGQSSTQKSRFQQRMERFHPSATSALEPAPSAVSNATEAPTGFDNLTNGYTTQDVFDANRKTFDEVENVADGLGPIYNAQSCRECHQNVVSGGASQITEQRTGRMKGNTFFESVGGTLIESRATYPDILEHVSAADGVRTFRISTNTLGAGFVEAIADGTLLNIRDSEPTSMRGTALQVPVLEAAESVSRVGRFGWKTQHASLQSFAADAYLNEMGITSPLFPDENTSSGIYIGFGTPYDPVPDPEDDGGDVTAFADFMRATKAPARGAITPDVQAGEGIFGQIGCAVCHTSSIVTAAPGTPINGGTLTVSDALGNKTIHPYSDFLLHDVGTGDGIPFLPTADFASTASQIRTAPLWGLRTRNRLMHDGLSFSLEDAITRHGGQAKGVVQQYNQLSPTQKSQLNSFLNSL